MGKTGLTAAHLDTRFFSECLKHVLPDRAEIKSITPQRFDNGYGIVSNLNAEATESLVGHFRFDVEWTSSSGSGVIPVVIKSKASGDAVLNKFRSFYEKGEERLTQTFDQVRPNIYLGTHSREAAICGHDDPRFSRYLPRIFRTACDEEQGITYIAMELLENVSHLDTMHTPELWKPQHIDSALEGLANIHALFLDRAQMIRDELGCYSVGDMNIEANIAHWDAALSHCSQYAPTLFSPARVKLLESALSDYQTYWKVMGASPLTLVHNNFSLRNVYLKPTASGHELGVYDWEWALIHVPQRDVSEFLMGAIIPQHGSDSVHHYIEIYRQHLERVSGKRFPRGEFVELFYFASLDYMFGNLLLGGVISPFKKLDFLHRIFDTFFISMDAFLRRRKTKSA